MSRMWLCNFDLLFFDLAKDHQVFEKCFKFPVKGLVIKTTRLVLEKDPGLG